MDSTFGSVPRPRRTRPRPRLVAAVGAVVVAVVAAGCSGPGTELTTPTTTTAPPDAARDADAPAVTGTTRRDTTSTTSSTSTTAGPTSAPPSSTTSTSTGPGTPTSSVVVAPANQAFCDGFRRGVTELSSVGTIDERDPAQLARALQRIKTFFAELVAVAPPEIGADWQALNQAIQGVDSLERLNDAGFQTASEAADRIEAWSKVNCGFDPSNPI